MTMDRDTALRIAAAMRVDGPGLTMSLWTPSEQPPNDDDRPALAHLWLFDGRPLANLKSVHVLCDVLGDDVLAWWVPVEEEVAAAAATTIEADVTCTDCLGWLHA